jgi:hypothetical protein
LGHRWGGVRKDTFRAAVAGLSLSEEALLDEPLRGTISRWPSLTGKASQRALVSRPSKAIRSWVGKQKGQAAGVVIAFPTCASAS